jgi:hypothetical protein
MQPSTKKPSDRSGAGASGLQVIAVFEAAKGLLVLFAGFGVLSMIHRIKVGMLSVNIGIVLYMGTALWRSQHGYRDFGNSVAVPRP